MVSASMPLLHLYLRKALLLSVLCASTATAQHEPITMAFVKNASIGPDGKHSYHKP